MNRFSCTHLKKNFAGLEVLIDVNFIANSGEVTGLIGPNGAGKTTLFNCLTKDLPIDGGNILLDDLSILNSSKLAFDLGITRTFQHLKIIPSLTTFENIQIGCDKLSSTSLLPSYFPFHKNKDNQKLEDEITTLLKNLQVPPPYNEKNILSRPLLDLRKIELARALISKPKLLLLDEPVAGLNPGEKIEMTKLIKSCLSDQIVILVEHDLSFIKGICNTVHVLNEGRIIATDSPTQVFSHKEVKQAYLGEE